jgi:ribosomal protein L30E
MKDSLDLGVLCGKPFSVSVIVINDPGDSKILELAVN